MTEDGLKELSMAVKVNLRVLKTDCQRQLFYIGVCRLSVTLLSIS